MARPDDPRAPGAGSVALGPFNPPADYEFEAELQGEPPRHRTPELSTGRLAVRRRRTISGLLIAAAVCTAIAPIPFVQECGFYLVPLQYLLWIGIGLGVAAIAQLASDWAVRGPYRYVEEGRPLVARIRSVDLRVSRVIHGTPAYRFFALLEFRHPESGEPRTMEVTSNELSQLNVWLGLETTYRVGDYATAVYLPGKLEKSLRLYGFLDLKPGLGLIAAHEAREWTTRQIVLWFAFIFGMAFLPLWHLYIASKFWPLDVDPVQGIAVFVAGAVVLGGGFLTWQASRKRRNPPQPDGAMSKPARSRWARIVGSIRSAFFPIVPLSIGGMLMLCWCFAANALLDGSPPLDRPVQIDRKVSVTHHGIFREYKIEYHFLDGAREHHEILSTPPEMVRFFGNHAIAEVHVGRFGWPWVKAIHPAGKLL
jgi:hypothetical protein